MFKPNASEVSGRDLSGEQYICMHLSLLTTKLYVVALTCFCHSLHCNRGILMMLPQIQHHPCLRLSFPIAALSFLASALQRCSFSSAIQIWCITAAKCMYSWKMICDVSCVCWLKLVCLRLFCQEQGSPWWHHSLDSFHSRNEASGWQHQYCHTPHVCCLPLCLLDPPADWQLSPANYHISLLMNVVQLIPSGHFSISYCYRDWVIRCDKKFILIVFHMINQVPLL